jgi:hypothetical protein
VPARTSPANPAAKPGYGPQGPYRPAQCSTEHGGGHCRGRDEEKHAGVIEVQITPTRQRHPGQLPSHAHSGDRYSGEEGVAQVIVGARPDSHRFRPPQRWPGSAETGKVWWRKPGTMSPKVPRSMWNATTAWSAPRSKRGPG